jgi:hypothetical protein
MCLLAVWLILYGLLGFFQFSFSHSAEVASILALVAGILLLLGR